MQERFFTHIEVNLDLHKIDYCIIFSDDLGTGYLRRSRPWCILHTSTAVLNFKGFLFLKEGFQNLLSQSRFDFRVFTVKQI